MKGTEVPNPRRSSGCDCTYVLTRINHCLITLPQTVRLFYVFHCVLRLPNSSTQCFPFLRCEGMATVTNWTLHVHYGITLCAYLYQTHRPITLWAYLSEPLVKDTHNRPSSTENYNTAIPRAPSHVITITTTYVLQRGIRKHCTWRKWLT